MVKKENWLGEKELGITEGTEIWPGRVRSDRIKVPTK
jgi:hypothetical protein